MSVEEPPVRPAFRHKHALDLGLGLATSGGFASVDLASIVRPDIEQFAVSPEAWRSAPDYRKMPDGTLQVTYARKPIRHGEAERAGDEFEVRLPVGEHEIRWEVHAANMARPRRGTWRVSCRDVEEGEPVGKLAELEAALGINCDDENSE